MRDKKKRAARDHQRYLEKREEILAKQKLYRDTHKDEIRERRRRRNYEKRWANRENRFSKTKSELAHSYYIRHREEILARVAARYKRMKEQRNYERREQYKQHPESRPVADT